MPAPKVRSDHDALRQLARQFNDSSSNTHQMLQNLKSKMGELRGKDWIGKGADKFYAEMDSSVFPSLQRLTKALGHSAQITVKISQVMKQAEDDAAALFKGGDGGGGAAGGGAGGAPGAGGGGSPSGGGGGSSGGGGGSSGGGGGSSGGGGGSSGGGAATNQAARQATERMLAGFDQNVVDNVSRSPTMMNQMQQLEQNGWTVIQGPAGGGSYADRTTNTLVIERGQSLPNTLNTIAHEGGHAFGNPPPFHPPVAGQTRQQFIDGNVQENLRDEGFAQFTAAQARAEIQANGGPDIGIPGTQTAAYQAVYDQYRAGTLTQPQAIEQMANLMGNESTSTTGQNYRQYYGRSYEQYWDTNIGVPSL